MAVRRMPVSQSDPDATGRGTLSARQRFALCANVVSTGDVLSFPESELDVVYFLSRSVPIVNMRAAKVSPLDLKARGATRATVLRELGFDALDLCDAAFCASAVSAFGVEEVRRAFLLQAGDSVALAGSVATFQLDLSTRKLLEVCAGVPEAARAVLQQSEPRGGALHGVAVTILMDCGLRADALANLGYFVDRVREQTGASDAELRKLGFE
jgi:hypothetical protein